MEIYCPRSCGFCDDDSPEVRLHVEKVSLAGVDFQVLSARGVRHWHFFELPVARGDPAAGSCGSEEEEEGAADAAVAGSSSRGSSSSSSRCEAAPASGAAVAMQTHAAMAHYYDGRSHIVNSWVYRWSSGARAFEEHQALPSTGAWDLATFQLGGEWYLAVASFFDGHSRTLNSTIYRWVVGADAFILHQELPTVGAMDVEFFTVNASDHDAAASQAAFLAFTGNHDGRGAPGAECAIFRWNGATFEEFQKLAISGGYDAEAFQVHGADVLVLVVVNEDSADVYRASTASLLAPAPSAGRGNGRQAHQPRGFELLQRLDVPHGRDAKHFRAEGAEHLALAVFRDDTSHRVDSPIYRWSQEKRLLEEVQRLKTMGASDVELLEAGGEPLLLVANQWSGVSALHAWGSGGWKEAGGIATPRVYDLAWHRVNESDVDLLGVASF